MAQNEVKFRLSVDGAAKVRDALSGTDAQLQTLNSNLIKTAHYGAGLLVLVPSLHQIATGLIKSADAVTTLNSGLLLATGSSEKAAAAYEALFQIAQRSRTSFTELGTTFAAIARAGQTLGLSQQRLLVVTEAIGNAMAISGGSAQSLQAALVQLGQGLSSGTLRGEELNSILEQAPRLAKALADGLGVPIGALRKLGETGALTSQMVIAALEKSAPQLAKELASASLTVSQAMTMLSNSAVKFVGEADRATGASATLASALRSVAGALASAGETIRKHETAFAIIGGVLAGAATVAGVLALGKGLIILAGAVGGLGLAVAALNPVTLAILGVGVLAGGVMAASSSYDKTAGGIKRLIAQLEGADTELLRLRKALAENPGDISLGQYVRTLERDTTKRVESLRSLRQELALLNAGSAGSVAEDARLDRGTQAFAERTARATALAEVMGKLSGVNADFSKNLQTLHASYAAGETTLEAYRAQVGELILKEGGGKEMLAKSAAAMRGGNAALAERIALMAQLYGGPNGMQASVAVDLRRAEIAETDAVNARLLADTMADQARATDAAAKAHADLIKQLDASADSVAAQVQKLQDEEQAATMAAARNISLAEAIELVTVARLHEQKAVQMSFGDEQAAGAIQREIDKRRELAGLIAGKEARQASADSAKEAATEWQKTSDSINQSLTDALFRSFESGKGFGRTLRDSLVNTFKTMVLRPIISAIVSPVAGAITGALGFSGAASAGGSAAGSMAGSAAGSALSSSAFGAAGASIFGSSAAYGAAIGTTNIAAGSQAAMLAAQTGQFGLYGAAATSSAAAGAGAGAASAGSAAMAAIPYVAIALVIANAMGLFRSTKQTAGGLVGSFGSGNISDAIVQREGGTLFRGPDYQTYITGISASSKLLQEAFNGLRTNTAAQAAALGLSTDNIRSFTTAIGSDVMNNDAGTRGLSLQGLTPAQAQQKIAEALQTVNEKMAEMVLGIGQTITESVVDAVSMGFDENGTEVFSSVTRQVNRTMAGAGDEFRRTGETAVQALGRLSGSLSGVNGVLGLLGAKLYATTLAGGDLASQLADLFGGLSNFKSTTGAYFEAYFTDAERAAALTGQLSGQMRALGFSLPATRAGFRRLVEAQELTTDAGRRTYAALLQLSGAFAELVDDGTAAAEQAGKLRDAWRSVGDTIAAEVARIRGSAQGATLAGAQSAFAVATAQARAGDQGAAATLPELSRKVLELAEANAGSAEQLGIIRGTMAASLERTAGSAYARMQANPDSPLGDALNSIGRLFRKISGGLADKPTPRVDLLNEDGRFIGFANGGRHAGGLRIVGENGPELEATGASRIWTARQTADMVAGAGSNTATVAELQALRAELRAGQEAIAAATQAMAKQLARWDDGGAMLTKVAV